MRKIKAKQLRALSRILQPIPHLRRSTYRTLKKEYSRASQLQRRALLDQ